MNARLVRWAHDVTIEIITETCYSCGCIFGMTVEFQENRLADKQRFFCPNGHGQSYTGKSASERAREAEVARDEAERARRAAEARAQALRDQLDAAERERKRHEERTKNGVCPCCKRSFVQLQRHMKAKHPEYGS